MLEEIDDPALTQEYDDPGWLLRALQGWQASSGSLSEFEDRERFVNAEKARLETMTARPVEESEPSKIEPWKDPIWRAA